MSIEFPRLHPQFTQENVDSAEYFAQYNVFASRLPTFHALDGRAVQAYHAGGGGAVSGSKRSRSSRCRSSKETTARNGSVGRSSHSQYDATMSDDCDTRCEEDTFTGKRRRQALSTEEERRTTTADSFGPARA